MDDEPAPYPSALVKWPFYASSIFIIGFVLFFALNREADDPMDQWQLATCVLSTALASILFFFPFLLEKFLDLSLNPSADREEQLIQKIYFEIKEARDDLAALGVKIEKTPGLVEKVVGSAVTDALPNDDAAFTETVKLGTELDGLRKEIAERLDALLPRLEAAAAPPNNAEALDEITDALDALRERLDETFSAVQSFKPRKRSRKQAAKEAETSEPEIPELEIPEPETPEPELEKAPPLSPEPKEEPEAEQVNDPQPEEAPETEETPEAPSDEDELETLLDTDDAHAPELQEPDQEQKQEPLTEAGEEPIPDPAYTNEPEPEPLPEPEPEEETEEDDLPDPDETLRKVDAILAETSPGGAGPSRAKKPKEPAQAPASAPGGATSVVANVMIGIGNKPFVRGEGPGLDWDKGEPMNFVELGKWAWSPPDKSAPLTIQIYRNDEQPDSTGKHQVQPGQKFEITPEFED